MKIQPKISQLRKIENWKLLKSQGRTIAYVFFACDFVYLQRLPGNNALGKRPHSEKDNPVRYPSGKLYLYPQNPQTNKHIRLSASSMVQNRAKNTTS